MEEISMFEARISLNHMMLPTKSDLTCFNWMQVHAVTQRIGYLGGKKTLGIIQGTSYSGITWKHKISQTLRSLSQRSWCAVWKYHIFLEDSGARPNLGTSDWEQWCIQSGYNPHASARSCPDSAHTVLVTSNALSQVVPSPSACLMFSS